MSSSVCSSYQEPTASTTSTEVCKMSWQQHCVITVTQCKFASYASLQMPKPDAQHCCPIHETCLLLQCCSPNQLAAACVIIVTPGEVCLSYESVHAQLRCISHLPRTLNMLAGSVLLCDFSWQQPCVITVTPMQVCLSVHAQN